jgi:hypothetical protein
VPERDSRDDARFAARTASALGHIARRWQAPRASPGAPGAQRIAAGATVEPEKPFIFRGCITKANS